MFAKSDSMGRSKFSNTHSDPNLSSITSDEDFSLRKSCVSSASPGTYDLPRVSGDGSPLTMSPWNHSSPFTQSPWSSSDDSVPHAGLIGSLVREEGHIYSLAAMGGLLYTGSDSKNIRVWKDLNEFAAFKSNSGLVKAIVISGDKIFSGHQDGKIRVWKVNSKKPSLYKRSGSLPTLKDVFKASIRPSNYVEVRKKKSSLWIKHSDALSCLSLRQDQGFLYSASWDRTFKVWRVSDSKCLESVSAHDDAVNALVTSKDGFVFTGAADGSVKMWKREMQGKVTKHTFVQTLLDQDSAVTALTISPSETVLYCGSSDGLVNFWEREKQLSHGGVLRGHKLAVLCLATAGNLVFSGSADKSICVWKRDGTAHTCLSVLTGHAGPVKCLAVEEEKDKSSSGSWKLYSGSLDKSVKVWSVSNQAIDYSQSDRMSSQLAEPVWDSAPSDQSLS